MKGREISPVTSRFSVLLENREQLAEKQQPPTPSAALEPPRGPRLPGSGSVSLPTQPPPAEPGIKPWALTALLRLCLCTLSYPPRLALIPCPELLKTKKRPVFWGVVLHLQGFLGTVGFLIC